MSIVYGTLSCRSNTRGVERSKCLCSFLGKTWFCQTLRFVLDFTATRMWCLCSFFVLFQRSRYTFPRPFRTKNKSNPKQIRKMLGQHRWTYQASYSFWTGFGHRTMLLFALECKHYSNTQLVTITIFCSNIQPTWRCHMFERPHE